MTHEAVSTGGSPWRILVDGVEQDGTHDDLHKAQARGYRILEESPDAEVVLRRDSEIRLSLTLPTGDDTTEPETEPEPTGDHPHEPAGMAVMTERAWDALDEDGWGKNDDPGYTIEQAADAPRSPPNVGQMFYPAGVSDSYSPTLTWRSFEDQTRKRLYLHFFHRFSENWHGHESGVNKLLYLLRPGEPGVPAIVNAHASDDGPLYPQVRMQDGTWGNYGRQDAGSVDAVNEANVSEAEARLTRGQWHEWELDLIYNTEGNRDGTIRLWIDGTLVLHYPGTAVFSKGVPESELVWGTVKWDPIWGGRNDTLPVDQFQQMDHLYASVGE